MDEKMEKTTKKTTKAAKSAPAAKDEKMSIEEKKSKIAGKTPGTPCAGKEEKEQP